MSKLTHAMSSGIPIERPIGFKWDFDFKHNYIICMARRQMASSQHTSYGCFCNVFVWNIGCSFILLHLVGKYSDTNVVKPLFSRVCQVASSCFEGCWQHQQHRMCTSKNPSVRTLRMVLQDHCKWNEHMGELDTGRERHVESQTIQSSEAVNQTLPRHWNRQS